MDNWLNEIGRFGIILDICGAVLLSKSVFLQKSKDIFRNSSAFLGYNHYKTVEGIRAKFEAITGIILLVLGFVGQYIGTFQKSDRLAYKHDIWFLIFCVALILLTNFIIKKYAENKTKQLVVDKESKNNDN